MATNKKGITVRFEDHEMKQIEALAERYSVNSTTIIRWALKALGDYVAARNGKIQLPLDFSDFFEKSGTGQGFTIPDRSTILNDEPKPKTSSRTRA